MSDFIKALQAQNWLNKHTNFQVNNFSGEYPSIYLKCSWGMYSVSKFPNKRRVINGKLESLSSFIAYVGGYFNCDVINGVKLVDMAKEMGWSEEIGWDWDNDEEDEKK